MIPERAIESKRHQFNENDAYFQRILADMIQSGEKISINALAIRAGVSRTTIYNHKDLVNIVQNLKKDKNHMNEERSR